MTQQYETLSSKWEERVTRIWFEFSGGPQRRHPASPARAASNRFSSVVNGSLLCCESEQPTVEAIDSICNDAAAARLPDNPSIARSPGCLRLPNAHSHEKINPAPGAMTND